LEPVQGLVSLSRVSCATAASRRSDRQRRIIKYKCYSPSDIRKTDKGNPCDVAFCASTHTRFVQPIQLIIKINAYLNRFGLKCWLLHTHNMSKVLTRSFDTNHWKINQYALYINLFVRNIMNMFNNFWNYFELIMLVSIIIIRFIENKVSKCGCKFDF